MNKNSSRYIKVIKKCFKDISFRDKGLVVIMIILLSQCIYNLYNADPTGMNYESINIIVRTSVAGIFGYFLSSNFLNKIKNIDEEYQENSCELKILEDVLKDEESKKKIEDEYKRYNEGKEIKKEKERYFCNKTLQNFVAIGICIISILALIIGLNFRIIPEGATATISQFRDLISGCIGFLLGNSNSEANKSNK